MSITQPALGNLDTAPSSSSMGEAAKPRRYYRPELDVLRFFAFMLVFAHHTVGKNVTAHGFHPIFAFEEGSAAGVCLFFTLSSFLITELLFRERETTGRVHIPSFYVRRILRIWPLYLLVVFAAAIVPHLPHFSQHLHSADAYILPYLLLAGNWANVFHGKFPPSMLLGSLWSIPVEEQFYLIWPTLVAFGGVRGLVTASVVLLPLGWFVDYLIPSLHPAIEPQLWCNSISQFQFFALGALLALFAHRREFRPHTALRWAAGAAAMVLLLLSGEPFHYLHDRIPAHPGQVVAGYMCIDAACVLLLLAFLGARMPSFTRPLVYLGKISFGLYVFHLPIHEAVALVVAKKLPASPILQWVLESTITLAISIAVASASYQFFEKPFLRLKKRFTFVPSRPA
jgi:peptidoglycan/LPS O-acetylase OafA/YrhL